MKKIFIFLGITILLSSCQILQYGVVIDKTHEPAYSSTYPISIGRPDRFSLGYIYIHKHHREHYLVKVLGITTKGDTLIKTYKVSSDKYKHVKIDEVVLISSLRSHPSDSIK